MVNTLLKDFMVDGKLIDVSYVQAGLVIERACTKVNACDYSEILFPSLMDMKLEPEQVRALLETLLEEMQNGSEYCGVIAWAIGKSYSDYFTRIMIAMILSKKINCTNCIEQILGAAEISQSRVIIEFVSELVIFFKENRNLQTEGINKILQRNVNRQLPYGELHEYTGE